jgi:ribose-phosphate pyrophosphokinase
MATRGNLSILACSSGKAFAQRIVDSLNQIVSRNVYSVKFRLKETEEVIFANGEIKTVIHENVRGDDVYIVQCVDDPNSDLSVNDNLMAILTATNAAYQSDAESVTVVLPQFPYARQERRKTREGITAKQVAQFLEISGAHRVITLDIHAEAIQGFFNTAKLENLHASRYIINYLRETLKLDTSNLVATGPDVGSAEKARFYSKELKCDLAIVDKARDYSKASVVESMRLVGNVEGRDVLIIDDMIATGGTLINAAKLLRDKGARRIIAACSLPFFNSPSLERINKAYEDGILDLVIGTDAVFWGEEFVEKTPWYHEITIAPLFAHVIYNINKKRSVSELLR